MAEVGQWIEANFSIITPGTIYTHDEADWYLALTVDGNGDIVCLHIGGSDRAANWSRTLMTSGEYNEAVYIWDGKELPDGTYVYRTD